MLQGQRVLLRALERSDAAAMYEVHNDVEVATRVSSRKVHPRSLARIEADIDAASMEPHPSYVRWGIEAPHDGPDGGPVIVGSIELWEIDEHNAMCSLGLALRRESWSKGYGSDAIRTAVAYAFTHLNLRKVSLTVLADDARAVKCYLNAGFVEEGRLRQHSWYDGAYRDLLAMGILRD